MDHQRKPRPRRRVLKIVLCALAALSVGIVIMLTRAYSAKPGAGADVVAAYNKLVADHFAQQPGAINGFDTLAAACAAHSRASEATHAAWPEEGPDDWWPDPVEWAEGRASLGTVQATEIYLRLLAAEPVTELLLQLPNATFAHRDVQQGELLLDSDAYPIGGTRALARYLRMRMIQHARSGEWPAYLRDLQQCLAIGRILGGEPLLIHRLVATSILAMAANGIIQDIKLHQLGEPTLRGTLELLDRDAVLPPMAFTYRGESLFLRHQVELCHTDNGHGDGTALISKLAENSPDELEELVGFRIPAHKALDALGFILPSKKQSLRHLETLEEDTVAFVTLPPRSRVDKGMPNLDSLALGYVQVRGAGMDSMVMRANDQIDLQLVLTKTTLAIELFRATHGKLPATLDELVPEILATVPIDPYTSKPLCYRVLAPAEAAARGGGYLVYSTGIDGVDDGGISPGKVLSEAIKAGATGVDAMLE
ncbi:MAG: hypothetical protein H7Y88_11925 [Phycisphaerales bacterium]|nr:hypothetical protein [Phycisphaerales bacterium]